MLSKLLNFEKTYFKSSASFTKYHILIVVYVRKILAKVILRIFNFSTSQKISIPLRAQKCVSRRRRLWLVGTFHQRVEILVCLLTTTASPGLVQDAEYKPASFWSLTPALYVNRYPQSKDSPTLCSEKLVGPFSTDSFEKIGLHCGKI